MPAQAQDADGNAIGRNGWVMERYIEGMMARSEERENVSEDGHTLGSEVLNGARRRSRDREAVFACAHYVCNLSSPVSSQGR